MNLATYTSTWRNEEMISVLCATFNQPKFLDPSYCYPESWNLPYEKKLLALDKNHQEIRR